MAIKEILVHATHGSDCLPRLEASVRLAAHMDAHLTAIYSLWMPPMPVYVESQLGQEFFQHQHEIQERHAEAVREAFEKLVVREGVSAQWRMSDAARLETLALNARYCDLVVMGRHNDDAPAPSATLVESMLLDSPKPILVIPDEGAPRDVGSHVVVAWNGSREAIRAVDAALPVLKRARQVDVLVAVARSGPGEEHGDLPGADICAHLARHGIRAQAQAVSVGDQGVGETLLSRATGDGCDLLVMGAYGHARWREVVLGGVTAHVLSHSRLPMLLVH